MGRYRRKTHRRTWQVSCWAFKGGGYRRRRSALFCGVFCGIKPCEGRPRKHPGKPPAKNTTLLEVVKKRARDLDTEGRFGHQAVWNQRACEDYIWGIWHLTARCPGLPEQKSWLLSIFKFVGLFRTVCVMHTRKVWPRTRLCKIKWGQHL